MSTRLDPSCIVVKSVENPQHDRCVDVFTRLCAIVWVLTK
jgi:hypothetical protein